MKTYLQALAAYLTGWLIAQSIFTRVANYVRADAIQNDRDGWRTELSVALAQELANRLHGVEVVR